MGRGPTGERAEAGPARFKSGLAMRLLGPELVVPLRPPTSKGALAPPSGVTDKGAEAWRGGTPLNFGAQGNLYTQHLKGAGSSWPNSSSRLRRDPEVHIPVPTSQITKLRLGGENSLAQGLWLLCWGPRWPMAGAGAGLECPPWQLKGLGPEESRSPGQVWGTTASLCWASGARELLEGKETLGSPPRLLAVKGEGENPTALKGAPGNGRQWLWELGAP